MKKIKLSELIFLALCCDFGFYIKKFVSPVTNILTDFIHLPGGSAASGFAMMFLVLGVALVPRMGAATLMGAVQALLAIALGMTGYQGPLCVITYILPGIMIDIVARCFKKHDRLFFITACSLANMTGSIVSAILVFKFNTATLLLWLFVSLCSGALCGCLGKEIYGKIQWITTSLKARKTE